MNHYVYLTALAYVFLGELIAFSICQLLLIRRSNRVHVFLWIGASVFSALGTAFSPHLLTIISVNNFGVWGGLAALLGGVLRYFALTYRQHSFDRHHYGRFFLWLTLILLPITLIPAFASYRLLASSIVGASVSAACFFGMLYNPIWYSRNNLGLVLSLTGMAISTFALLFRGLTSYPFGADQLFIGDSELQRHAFEVLVLISFFLQIGFTGMLAARRDQEDVFADRRAVRAGQRAQSLAKRKLEVSRVSRERFELIQLLTHEVRQPINNAQASLQSISLNLRKSAAISGNAAKALARAQTSLDYITLALSNVIVAATLITQTRKWTMQQVDGEAILDMARLDCRPEDRSRISTAAPDGSVFIFGMPILLRVALHNLFDQAITLAAPGTEIAARIMVDEHHQLAIFDIRFEAVDPTLCDDGLFARRRSSDRSDSPISSLGLFVVRQVARAHNGDAGVERRAGNVVSFQLMLPY